MDTSDPTRQASAALRLYNQASVREKYRHSAVARLLVEGKLPDGYSYDVPHTDPGHSLPLAPAQQPPQPGEEETLPPDPEDGGEPPLDLSSKTRSTARLSPEDGQVLHVSAV